MPNIHSKKESKAEELYKDLLSIIARFHDNYKSSKNYGTIVTSLTSAAKNINEIILNEVTGGYQNGEDTS